MNPHPALEKILDWLVNHSLQAGALVLLVLAVQWIFRRQLTHRWRFALWWIVLARLLLPFSPQSAVSVFNYFQPHVSVEGLRDPATAVPIPIATRMAGSGNLQPSSQTPGPAAENISEATEQTPTLEKQTATASVTPAAGQPGFPPVINFNDLIIPEAAGLWLVGVLGLSMCAAVQTIRFRRRLTRASASASPALIGLFNETRREAGVMRPITLLETDAVNSPALYGLWRLRLLLPRGLEEKFSPQELRYICLHELAHVKRGDLWLNWLVTGLQILHWFNPLVWFGFARLRADRELACDELALVCAGDQAGTFYGETVIKLLESLNHPAAVPGLMGILEDRHQMRRRISMIAKFRQPGRWSVLAVLLIAAMAAVALTDAQTEKPGSSRGNEAQSSSLANSNGQSLLTSARPDLTGQMLGEDGAPLPVPAAVFIATAGPKTGTSTFCPSCYADCQKSAKTDAQGNFDIKSLDPQLRFQVLAVAKGYQPKYVNDVDPANGKPVKIKLEPIESADAAPDRSLRGRVVDAHGHPIEGAVVDMVGIETKDGGGSYGMLAGIDPLAVSDGNGEFLITAKKPFDMMDAKVSARTFADKPFKKLPSGRLNQLVMTEGAALAGRVVRDGKPLAGVSVGVSAVDRTAGNNLGHFEVGTSENGDFAFVNLPPDADFEIYTLMGTMKKLGAVLERQIHTGKDGETTNVGDLTALPAHRLAGRVVLADGQPLPAKTRLLISREAAWDSMQIIPDQGGYFDTAGIPDELISLSARVKGYRVSARNLSVDEMNPFQLIGRVDRDITNLVLMLERGPDPQPDYSHVDPDYNQSRQRPLRGAEGVPDHSREWFVSGRVLDSETKEPVKNLRVTPGETDSFNRTRWNTLHAVDGTNGFYLTYFGKRVTQPVLKVEADGYLPAGVNLQPCDATNLDFLLKRGSGPAGTLVTPDGKPAAGATLVLLTGELNEAGLNSAGELSTYGNRSAMCVADTNGTFSFKPMFGMKWLAASASNGFTVVSLKSLATNSTVTLQPYGTITGTLKRTSGPGTNETLDINFAGDNSPHINLWRPTDTDAQGRFEFNNVPPSHLQISNREKISTGNGWSENPLQQVDLKPGQTLEVKISAADRPAAPEMKSYQPPQPKMVPGVQLRGIVLLPNGKPAADADVALQVEDAYLGLGKAAFTSNDARDKGLLVSAGPDGSFTLPMYEKAQSIIALNESGIAQVSLEQLKASPQITLQKWGRIEGTLRVGHYLGTNERVMVSAAMRRWSSMTIRKPGQTNGVIEITNASPKLLQPPFYDSAAFGARTDDQGRFIVTFVPPGKQVLSRMVPAGAGSWTSSQLATVEVEPGETVVTNVGGMGHTVIGTLKVADGSSLNFTNGYAVITTPTFKFMEQSRKLKTDAERQAFYQSPEVQKAYENFRSFSGLVLPDGSFRVEDVLPGNYEVNFQQRLMPDAHTSTMTMFTSAREVTVPAAKDANDDSSVDLGTVELKKFDLPIPKMDSSKK